MKFQNYEALEHLYENSKKNGHDIFNYVRLQPYIEEFERWIDNEQMSKEDEINCIFDMDAKGIAVIMHHFEKKHGLSLPIKIISDLNSLPLLETVLTEFNQKPHGSKLTIFMRWFSHWSVIHCEKNQKINQIAIMDPLAFRVANINIMDDIFEKNIDLKTQSILYKPLQNIQCDDLICATLCCKIAQKILVETSFFENLKNLEFILSQKEAKEYFNKHNLNTLFFNQQSHDNIQYFILPPEYFCLHQRSSHLEYYTKDFGSRRGVTLFSHNSKSGKTMTLEEHYNREDRKPSLSQLETNYCKKFQITKHDAFHFARKYGQIIRDVLATEVNDSIHEIHDRYIL